MNDYVSYTVLTFDKKWTAKSFYFDPSTDSIISKKVDIKINLDTVFSNLVLNNIFSLPDQNSLQLKKLTYLTESNQFLEEGMGDNHVYYSYIEFKIGDCYRHYQYHDVHDFANYYSQVHEFKKFVNIVTIFNRLIKE